MSSELIMSGGGQTAPGGNTGDIQYNNGGVLGGETLVPLAHGGTNADLSASGSSTAFLAQNASHVVSARSLVETDIPFHMGPYLPNLKNYRLGASLPTQQIGSGDGAALNYTVPANSRAVALVIGGATNSNEAVITEAQFVATGSTWIQMASVTNTITSPPGTCFNDFLGGFIFEAGDLIALKTGAGNAAAFCSVFLFDSSSPLKTPRVVGNLTLGDNVIYTVPNGMNALGIYFQSTAAPTFNLKNAGLGTVSELYHRIPFGQTVSAMTRLRGGSPGSFNTVAALALATDSALSGWMNAGDYIDLVLGGPTRLTASSVATPAGGSAVYTGTFTGGNGSNLTLTQATVSGGSVQYTGTITGGATNAFVGATFTIAGFTNAGNNGTFVCTASTTTVLTLTNAGGVNETHAGTASQNLFAGGSFVIQGFLNPLNNGVFTCTASTATTVKLTNPNAVAGTAAGAASNAALSGFAISSVAAASAGSTTYTGQFNGGASNGLASWSIAISGFANSGNNGTFPITASSATTITVTNSGGVAETLYGASQLTTYGPVVAYVNFILESTLF